jgi:hypothetical protein
VADATGAFADKNVADGKQVSISGITLGGADVGNYVLADNSATTTADILRRDALDATTAYAQQLYREPAQDAGSSTGGNGLNFISVASEEEIGECSEWVWPALLMGCGDGKGLEVHQALFWCARHGAQRLDGAIP